MAGEEPQTFDDIFQAIKADPQNAEYTAAGIDPLYAVAEDARVMVIGQAPGHIAQETRIPWNDKSGDRLRDWMGVDRATFYDPHQVAIVPMDFYFPVCGEVAPRAAGHDAAGAAQDAGGVGWFSLRVGGVEDQLSRGEGPLEIGDHAQDLLVSKVVGEALGHVDARYQRDVGRVRHADKGSLRELL